MKRIGVVFALAFCMPVVLACAQATVETVKVLSSPTERTVRLPGEISPYLSVTVSAKVSAFVGSMEVDRGTRVRKGQLLATLVAPELGAQRAGAEARAKGAEAGRIEAEARLLGLQGTYERLKEASQTSGAVAGNELRIAEQEVAGARALVEARQSAAAAARSSAQALQDLEGYLKIAAPFDGVITERFVHPGALVGPSSASAAQLYRLEQVSRLRVVVAVPEVHVGGIVRGAKVSLRVPAFPGETFSGTLTRVAGSLDIKTRTMPVEVDVQNAANRLAPGMYPEVMWPVRNSKPSLLVPASSIVTTTERSFVIRLRNGKAEWVDVVRGALIENLVEVFGTLEGNDEILRRGSDEIREGTSLAASTL